MADKTAANKFAELDQLSTEALKALIRADIDSPNTGKNDEMIFHILEVIEQREDTTPEERAAEVDRAWKEFHQYYATEDAKGVYLYPSEDPDLPQIQSKPRAHSAPARPGWLWRVVSIAAFMVCLFAVIAPPAMGYDNVFRMIAQWTDSQFRLVPSGEDTGPQTPGVSGQKERNYNSLEDALDAYEIEEAIAPKWIPDGFALTSVNVWESDEENKVTFNAFYESGDKSISILLVRRETLASAQYEKSDTPVNTYAAGGIEHHLFDNNGRTMAVWNIGNFECSMMGDIQTETMERMIDSIYER